MSLDVANPNRPKPQDREAEKLRSAVTQHLLRMPLGMLRYLYSISRKITGVFPRESPLCLFQGKFGAFGIPPRYDAQCPSCRSLERHRLLKLWVDRSRIDLAAPERNPLLHFAPEPAVRRLFQPRTREYITADIQPGAADRVLDIEKLDLADASIGTVCCSHVLEHVDHRRALGELFRVLKPGGLAILMFPVIEGWSETYENPEITSKEGRTLHFGQFDHTRYFGADIRKDITRPGFRLSEFTAVEPDVARYGLMRGEKVFLAQKPLNPPC